MPNFQTKTLTPLKYPHYEDGVTFLWEAKAENETLIFTKYKDEEFFIKQIKRDKNILIKGDKLANPSRVKYLQDVLNVYEKCTNSLPLYSNTKTSKNRLKKQSEYFKEIEFFATKFEDFYKKWDEVSLEVGFGSGRHLLYQAKKHKKTLFIGAEIHKPSIEQVVKQCQLQEISNILIINFDARVLMEFFPSNIISKIFVHFPIPWDKKPHRRIISQEFINEVKRVLKVDGKLELRTDSDAYFEYSFKTLLNQKSVFLEICKNKDIEISSKYEDRWKKLNKNIYDLTMTNKESSEAKKVPKRLKFKDRIIKNNFKKDTILKKKWFVHFEKCYTIDENNFLWQIAFGDTAHVKHCYVKVFDNKASYFPKPIYATKSNLKAHKQINKRLK